jgi:uncharacterized protein YndB with AHSA1/START domain
MTIFKTQRQLPVTSEKVFAAIADPTRLAKWWGPDGFTNQFASFDFSVGGKWAFTMIGPDGTAYPNEAVFSAIVPDRRVVIRHTCQPFFTLTITLQSNADGTLLEWAQAFDDAAVAQAVRRVVEPANEQNLDRLARILF